MDINFELYKIFYYAAKQGSFSDAAGKLYITQSAVSQAIKNLEEKIGTRLFIRKTRSIKLTDEGELLLKHVEQAYNFIKKAEGEIAEMQNLDSGTIKIGVGDTVCKYFLISHLKEYSRRYPNIKIQVINRTSSLILDILKRGLIDLGIVSLPVNDNSVTAAEFITVEDIFVASDRYSCLKEKTVSLEELTGYPVLMLQKDSTTRRNIDKLLQSKNIQLVPEIELESIDLLVEFARIGLGIAHVLKESAAALIESRELFQIELTEALPPRQLGIVTMKDVPLSRASSEFMELIINS